MHKLKSSLIETWRIGSGPWRRLRLQRMIAEAKVPVFSVFYHRVADEHENPWSMSFEQFRTQMVWFKENFDVVSMGQLQDRIKSGENSRPAVSVTFDDGYAENCDQALPFLIEENIPCTYFVTTEHTTNQQPFPHDAEKGFDFPVNTIESLKALAAAGIEIGAHTRTHLDLGSTNDPEIIFDEVITATRELERLLERKINYFAFPYGQYENLNVDAFQLLKQHGFSGVCSAYGGWNEIGGDAFHIQRLHGDPSFTRMRNWLSYDPRISKVKRFDYTNSESTINWKPWLEANGNQCSNGQKNCEVSEGASCL